MLPFAFVFAAAALVLAVPASAQEEAQGPSPAELMRQRVVDDAIKKLIEAQKREAQRVRDLEAYGKACGDKPGCWSSVKPGDTEKPDTTSEAEKAARARCAKIEGASQQKACLDEVNSKFKQQKAQSDGNVVAYDVSEEERKAELLARNPYRNLGATDLCPAPHYFMTAINGCHPVAVTTVRTSVVANDLSKEAHEAALRDAGASDLCPPPYLMTAINGCHPAGVATMLKGSSAHASSTPTRPPAASPTADHNAISWSVSNSAHRPDPAEKLTPSATNR